MTQEFEAKYAQLVKDAECPEESRVWLMKKKLINAESFGRAAPTEEKFMTEVTAVASSDGVKFGIVGENVCVAGREGDGGDSGNGRGNSGGHGRTRVGQPTAATTRRASEPGNGEAPAAAPKEAG